MDEQTGLSDQYRTSSPWPMLIAFGFVISEVGVLFGWVPIAVGGILLFTGSVSGILRESGYVQDPWPVLMGLGGVLIGLGIVGFFGTGGSFGQESLLVIPNGLAFRGLAITLAGIVSVVAGVFGRAWFESRAAPDVH